VKGVSDFLAIDDVILTRSRFTSYYMSLLTFSRRQYPSRPPSTFYRSALSLFNVKCSIHAPPALNSGFFLFHVLLESPLVQLGMWQKFVVLFLPCFLFFGRLFSCSFLNSQRGSPTHGVTACVFVLGVESGSPFPSWLSTALEPFSPVPLPRRTPLSICFPRSDCAVIRHLFSPSSWLSELFSLFLPLTSREGSTSPFVCLLRSLSVQCR